MSSNSESDFRSAQISGRISGQLGFLVKYPVTTKNGSAMEDGFVKRWLAQVDEYRWIMYQDEEDIEEWDAILEIRMPEPMAHMLDLIQSNYFHMQMYFESQWELMQRKLAMDAGDESVSGDDVAFQEAFNAIILQNNLDNIGKEKDADED